MVFGLWGCRASNRSGQAENPPAQTESKSGQAVTDDQDYKLELIEALRRANDTETEATRKLDKTRLGGIFKGAVLKREEEFVDGLKEKQIYREGKLEKQEFESFKLLDDGKRAEVVVTEGWSSVYRKAGDGKCYSMSPRNDSRQTVILERDGNKWFVTDSTRDSHSPPASIVPCANTP